MNQASIMLYYVPVCCELTKARPIVGPWRPRVDRSVISVQHWSRPMTGSEIISGCAELKVATADEKRNQNRRQMSGENWNEKTGNTREKYSRLGLSARRRRK